jgi:ribosomal protein S18 acetylase RimI-like enzyme
MNTALTIRDARSDERAAIEELTQAAYAEYATVMTPSAWDGLAQAVRTALATTDENVERIVAEHNGALVGSVLLYPPQVDTYSGALAPRSAPEVRLLAVAPEARGQGVGRALMHECIERARRAGATELGLHTSDSLRVAIHLYERLGFVRAPEYDFQPPGAEVVKAYRLPLDGPSREAGDATSS